MVETALIGSFVLIPIALGMIDFGYIFYTSERLNGAIEAATLYAVGNSTTSPDPINQAALASYGASAPDLVAAAPSTVCYCLDMSSGTMVRSAASCGASCPQNQTMGTYVALSYSTEVSLPFPVPGLSQKMNLTANGMARIK